MSGWSIGDLQREAAEWRERNFPDQLSHQPLIGLGEELGELAEAMGEEPPYAQYLDAIADSAIFLVSYCSHMGFDAQELWDNRHSFEMPPRPLPMLFGSLCCGRLKIEQGIRGNRAFHSEESRKAAGAMLAHLERMAELQGVDFVGLIRRVWGEVSARDWVLNPENGEVK